MREELNKREEKLFDLIESKSFDELNAKELQCVLAISSEEEYRIQHGLIARVRNAEEQEISRPLILPTEKKQGVLMIPWYASISGAAAAFFIGMWLFKGTPETMIVEVPVATVDTVFIEKQIIDTIVQVKKEVQSKAPVEKMVKGKKMVSPQDLSNTLVEINAPNLNTKYIESKGVSLRNDETFALLEGLNF